MGEQILLSVGPSVLAIVIALLALARRAPSAAPAAPPVHSEQKIDLNGALETVLIKAMDSQAGMLNRVNELNVQNVQMAAEMMRNQQQRWAGRQRGRTARRSRDGVFLRNCRLCKNPMISDPTVAEIVAHSTHRDGVRAERIVERNGAIEAHVDESDVSRNGHTEQIECELCGTAHAPGAHATH